MNRKNNTMRPSPAILQQQLQIHDNNTVSTFREKQDDDTIGSDPKGKRILPSPSKVTPSTISNSTSIALTPEWFEQLGNLMKLHMYKCFLEIQSQDGNQRTLHGSDQHATPTDNPPPGRIEAPPELLKPDRHPVRGSSQ